jgi:hypothetical protein
MTVKTLEVVEFIEALEYVDEMVRGAWSHSSIKNDSGGLYGAGNGILARLLKHDMDR